MKKSFNFVFILSFPIIFGIIAISKYFVPLFFGQGYQKVIVLINILSPIILAIGLSNVIGTQYLLAVKRQKEFTISVISGAIINFIINMMLIWKYASVGAAIGTVIAESCVTAIQFFFIKSDFDIKEILKMSIKYIISSIIMFICCIFIGSIIQNSMYNILIQVVSGFFIYVIVLLVLDDDFLKLILIKMKENIKGDYNEKI